MSWPRRSVTPTPDAITKRLEKLGTPVIRDWAGTYLNIVGAELLDHARSGDNLHLKEAEAAATSLLACVREMQRR